MTGFCWGAVFLLLAACQQFDTKDTGSLAATVHLPRPAPTAAQIAQGPAYLKQLATAPYQPDSTSLSICGSFLDFAISGADFPTITAENAVFLNGQNLIADSTVTNIPAGTNRTLTISSKNVSTGAVICQGTRTGITIVAGATTTVGTLDLSGVGQLQFNLTWTVPGDLDLHVTPPGGEEIYFGHLSSANGGILDRDDTVGTGPENIFWPSTPPNGQYEVCVIDYSLNAPVAFIVTVTHKGNFVKSFTGSRTTGSSQGAGCGTTDSIDQVGIVTVSGNSVTSVEP